MHPKDSCGVAFAIKAQGTAPSCLRCKSFTIFAPDRGSIESASVGAHRGIAIHENVVLDMMIRGQPPMNIANEPYKNTFPKTSVR